VEAEVAMGLTDAAASEAAPFARKRRRFILSPCIKAIGVRPQSGHVDVKPANAFRIRDLGPECPEYNCGHASMAFCPQPIVADLAVCAWSTVFWSEQRDFGGRWRWRD